MPYEGRLGTELGMSDTYQEIKKMW